MIRFTILKNGIILQKKILQRANEKSRFLVKFLVQFDIFFPKMMILLVLHLNHC
jgi:hypothetical protein